MINASGCRVRDLLAGSALRETAIVCRLSLHVGLGLHNSDFHHAWTFTRSRIMHGESLEISPDAYRQEEFLNNLRSDCWQSPDAHVNAKEMCFQDQPVVYLHFDSCICAIHG